eukprot:158488-Chlamydomonas_euryale.AAC.1
MWPLTRHAPASQQACPLHTMGAPGFRRAPWTWMPTLDMDGHRTARVETLDVVRNPRRGLQP